jgi:CDP-diacylglycerol--glycerol-3-phosphate 3-phosphatidyltransferase
VILGSAICLVAVERYWWLPVALIGVRELGITAWRARWVREGLSIPARQSAKYKTLVQGVALALAVFPPLDTADEAVAVALWIAVAFTIVTGIQYVLDRKSALSRTGD